MVAPRARFSFQSLAPLFDLVKERRYPPFDLVKERRLLSFQGSIVRKSIGLQIRFHQGCPPQTLQ